jgi:transposase
MIETTRCALSVSDPALYVSFELGLKNWKLALTSAPGIKPWVRTVAGGDLKAVADVVARAKARFGLASATPVVSCYEAGRDGFWIHRALTTRGIHNRVVDSASIEVNRRARRSKTDRLDAVKLVTMLLRVCGGERGVWREVHVPSMADEAQRHVSRERSQLVRDGTRLVNQMRSLLATVGSRLPERRQGAWWTTVREWSGAALPASMQQRLAHAQGRLTLLDEQIAELEQQQRAGVARAATEAGVARLVQLKGIATTSASVLIDEGLLWRAFRNRRELGGFLGFRPVPYQSGEAARDVGIDRAGNMRWRSMMVQLAWGWLQWQPSSTLAQWYQRRFAEGGRRARRIGIVALARKLLIALWRYATTGVLPDGALLKGV